MSNKIFPIRINDDLLNRFKEICDNNNVTASATVRMLIEQYCQTDHINSINKQEMNTQISEIPSFSDENKRKFSVSEMYCGPGGIGYALETTSLKENGFNFSFDHSWATDYDPDSCQTYKNNVLKENSNSTIYCSDVRDLDIKKLNVTDGFLYGFPCNDFSNVGESKGLNGKFGALYQYGIEYINHANPLFIFAENVSGLSSSNGGDAFKKILYELEHAGDFGYTLTVNLYKFEDYGVPQARHRYIIVGIRKDLNLKFKVPKPTQKLKTCADAISNPPIPEDCSGQELTRQSSTVVERLSHIKPGENAWNSNLPKHLQLNVKGARLSHIYKRLDPNKPSYTVTGSGGGGTHVYHWSENRALTNRERARLQTFPDHYNFFGSKESVRKQIGMAVPVDGVKIILSAILKTFAKVPYDYINPSVNLTHD